MSLPASGDFLQQLKELIDRFRDGDADAIETIVSRFSHVIETECKKFGLWQYPEWSHSDLLQEVILRVWMHIDQFRGRDSINMVPLFESWLRKTTCSVLANIGRHRNARKRQPEYPVRRLDAETEIYVDGVNRTRTPSSIFAQQDASNHLMQLMGELLDEESRQILWLHVVDGFSLRKIAEQLELSYDQVRYRYHDSLSKLEPQIDP